MDTNTACKSCFTFLFSSALVENPGSRRLKSPLVTRGGTALLHSESHLRFKFISKLVGVEQRTKQQAASFLVMFPRFLTHPAQNTGWNRLMAAWRKKTHRGTTHQCEHGGQWWSVFTVLQPSHRPCTTGCGEGVVTGNRADLHSLYRARHISFSVRCELDHLLCQASLEVLAPWCLCMGSRLRSCLGGDTEEGGRGVIFWWPVGVKAVIYDLQASFAAEACSTTEDGDEPLHCPTGYECHIINPGNMAEGIPNRGQCIKLRGNPGQLTGNLPSFLVLSCKHQ